MSYTSLESDGRFTLAKAITETKLSGFTSFND